MQVRCQIKSKIKNTNTANNKLKKEELKKEKVELMDSVVSSSSRLLHSIFTLRHECEVMCVSSYE